MKELTDKELIDALRDAALYFKRQADSNFGSIYYARYEQRSKALSLAADRIESMQWISVEELGAYEGWCWIVYKGRVVESFRDHEYAFRFNRWSNNVYMEECISAVIPWLSPPPPRS